ncbi:MAG: TRCF domain-containing protein, partial [Bacteroidota bacterium]
DCTIETDFEALIPDEYVRNIGERLSLYNTLSSLVELDDLEKFRKDLVDRFGPIPEQVIDLIDLIKLRETAKMLGFLKIVLKKKMLIATFPNENNTSYYQSSMFTSMLQFIQYNGNLCKLKQTGKTLQVVFLNISSIESGQSIFNLMLLNYKN